jgi:hypothetical protein
VGSKSIVGEMSMEQRLVQLEASFSERIARLEEAVSRLSEQVSGGARSPETAWWKKVVGVFQDDPEFEAAMDLGRAYRESLRPKEEEVVEGTS